jgi:hypothetical protein
MAQKHYYKLGEKSSVFYDPKSKLKVTNGIPGVTLEITKQIKKASASGHIIRIEEPEFERMLSKLPEETRTQIDLDFPKEKPKPKVENPEDDEDGDEDLSEERKVLIKRLQALKLKSKEFKKISKLSDDDLESYLLDNE